MSWNIHICKIFVASSRNVRSGPKFSVKMSTVLAFCICNAGFGCLLCCKVCGFSSWMTDVRCVTFFHHKTNVDYLTFLPQPFCLSVVFASWRYCCFLFLSGLCAPAAFLPLQTLILTDLPWLPPSSFCICYSSKAKLWCYEIHSTNHGAWKNGPIQEPIKGYYRNPW